MRKIVNISINLLLFISTILIFFLDILVDEYKILKIFPLIFFLCYILFLKKSIFQYKSFSTTLYTIISFIRYVLIPYIFIVANYYPQKWYNFNLSHNQLYLGTYLMIYEIIILSCVCRYLSMKQNKIKNQNLYLKGSAYLYVALFLLCIIIYIFSKDRGEILNFFIIKVKHIGRINEKISHSLLIKRQLILSGITFMFLTGLSKLNINKRKEQFILLILGILNVCILFGERRSYQLYTFFTTIYIIKYYLGKKSKKIILFIGLIGMLSIVLFSIYKFLNVFQTMSYMASLKKTHFNLQEIARNFDAYYVGVFNTTINTNFKTFSNDISRMIYDYLYGVFGLNLLLKGKMLLTSQIYNNILYGDKMVMTGQLISAISYGYIYLGIIFCILVPLFNLLILFYIEKRMKMTRSLEVKYMLTYILLRIGLGVTGITSPLISYSTMYLGTVGLTYIGLLIIKFFFITNKKRRKIS